MIELRQPMIHGSDKEQLAQIKSYLIQFRNDLQYAFDNISLAGGTGNAGGSVVNNYSQNNVVVSSEGEKPDPLETFNSIKNLIIKNGDIIDAYIKEIQEHFDGEYVVQDDFNKYTETIDTNIIKNASGVSVIGEKTEIIEYNAEDETALIKTQYGFIKLGFLGDDEYGIQIGHALVLNEQQLVNNSIVITPTKMSFYDEFGVEMAYFQTQKLFVPQLIITKNVEKSGTEGTFKETIEGNGKRIIIRWIPKSEV